MKLKTRLMMFTAASALSANMALAAINPQALADAYVAEGYTYVEIKVGPTQTKLEAVKGNRKAEVVYDNATGDVIKQEFENAGNYAGRTGVEIGSAGRDFEDDRDDSDDDEDDDRDDDEGDDNGGDDDENDDDEGNDDNGRDDDENDDDEGDDDEGDDNSGRSGKSGNDDENDDDEGSNDD